MTSKKESKGHKGEGLSYEKAGVSIDAGDKAVDLIRDMVRSTYDEAVVGDLGGFAGFYSGMFPGMDDPLLVSSTDGVGTKLLPAIKTGIVDTVGIDLVAMCVNDIICTGARPLFFLDYLACAKNNPERTAQIIEGMVNGCRQAGCALIGGEMAEMPDMYEGDDFDLAGFCVGVVDRKDVIDGHKIEPGDYIIGLPSSGIHSNGYTLVRKIIEKMKFDLLDEVPPLPGRLVDYILEPTRIYVKPVLRTVREFDIKGIVNITGGGITGNLPRVLPHGVAALIDKKSWTRPRIFDLLQEWGSVDENEMYRVFNMGIGMIVIVSEENKPSVIKGLEEEHIAAAQIGVIEKGNKEVVYKL